MTGVMLPFLKGKYAKRNMVLLAFGIYLAFITPIIFIPEINSYDQRDEINCHHNTVKQFIEEFPNIRFLDYNTATTPLYQTFLALIGVFITDNIYVFRIITFLLSITVLVLLFNRFGKKQLSPVYLLLTTILALSPYFIGSAIRISTDNVAILFALLVLYFLEMKPPSQKNNLIISFFIAIAILTRQYYLWLMPVYFIYRFIQQKDFSIKAIFSISWPLLLPIVGYGYFVFLWKGFSQPQFSFLKKTFLNWEVFVYLISVFGFYSSLFFFWTKEYFTKNKNYKIIFPSALVLGFILLLIFPIDNTYPIADKTAFDRGGLIWKVGSKLPMLAGASSLLLVLFPIGLASITMIILQLIKEKKYLILLAVILWLTPYLFNTNAYQKYFEPFILIFLMFIFENVKVRKKALHYLLPVSYIIFYVLIDVLRFYFNSGLVSTPLN